MKPKVAVLIPSYNNADYLVEAMDSVLAQTYADFEVIVTDDGSSDESWQILTAYAQKDSRIRIFRNETNIGISATRNAQVEQVSPSVQYLALFDGDDVMMPRRLATQAAYLDTCADIAAVGSWFSYIDSNGAHIKNHTYKEKWCGKDPRVLYTSLTAQGCVMIRRDVLESVGGYNERIYGGEDYDLWLRILSQGLCIGNIQEILIHYRIHSAQGTMAHGGHQKHGFRVRWHYLWHGFFSLPGLATTLGFGILAILPKGVRNTLRTLAVNRL